MSSTYCSDRVSADNSYKPARSCRSCQLLSVTIKSQVNAGCTAPMGWGLSKNPAELRTHSCPQLPRTQCTLRHNMGLLKRSDSFGLVCAHYCSCQSEQEQIDTSCSQAQRSPANIWVHRLGRGGEGGNVTQSTLYQHFHLSDTQTGDHPLRILVRGMMSCFRYSIASSGKILRENTCILIIPELIFFLVLRARKRGVL